MCKLIFDYDFADVKFIETPQWTSYLPASISIEKKMLFEKSINEKFAKYCEQINKSDGKILVGYSMDGKSIVGYVLDCPNDLHKEIFG